MRALFAAADEDAATGGPDIVRQIFPTVAVIEVAGSALLADARRSRARAEELLGGREEGAGL